MSVNFELIIDTPGFEVDMKSGLTTLQGISDATRTIAETLLTEKVPERLTSKSNVRTLLKKNFKGSYGQIFSLEMHDEEAKKKFRKIGGPAFSELMNYFLMESLYLEPDDLSEKAQQQLDSLGDTAEHLTAQLRQSIMINIHDIARKFGHNIQLNFRKNSTEKIEIAKFNEDTSSALEAETDKKPIFIEASIRRLNANTGNGRLQLRDGDNTIPFGFSVIYQYVQLPTKRKFSTNLHHNNGIPEEDWTYLTLEVLPVRIHGDRIIKYIVKGIYE
ncbi:hypothetical protein KKQ11_18560 [Pseudomonas sp. MG-2]|uniref:hypothetical protein n=1 Tax=Pseudomonas sp. MG-2 TaxID=405714 RepID=UPI001C005EC0|nr:hypothetical protein [Pseudomonas sp. MG-2]MBT9237834.1 hypothetical protein [Pseudomonas sp. MG-2]